MINRHNTDTDTH